MKATKSAISASTTAKKSRSVLGGLLPKSTISLPIPLPIHFSKKIHALPIPSFTEHTDYSLVSVLEGGVRVLCRCTAQLGVLKGTVWTTREAQKTNKQIPASLKCADASRSRLQVSAAPDLPSTPVIHEFDAHLHQMWCVPQRTVLPALLLALWFQAFVFCLRCCHPSTATDGACKY